MATGAAAPVERASGLDLLEEWLAHRETRIAAEGERSCDPAVLSPGARDVALCRRLWADRT